MTYGWLEHSSCTYFDVLCIDEAEHAREPEIIDVVATLMRYQR